MLIEQTFIYQISKGIKILFLPEKTLQTLSRNGDLMADFVLCRCYKRHLVAVWLS